MMEEERIVRKLKNLKLQVCANGPCRTLVNLTLHTWASITCHRLAVTYEKLATLRGKYKKLNSNAGHLETLPRYRGINKEVNRTKLKK